MVEKLDFDELHELALKLSRKPPLTAENIYVDLMLTATIGEIQSGFDFVLKGGTAIIKAWLPPYRFSYDLDFSLFGAEKPKNQYRKYQIALEKLVSELGFRVVNHESDKHREGGRILILKLVDSPKYLRIPIKLSVSTIDSSPCFDPLEKKFRPVVSVPKKYGLLYPSVIPRISGVSVKVLALEELCAEKIRALATRGTAEGWSPLMRDVVDVYMMEQNGVLDAVLEDGKCLGKKFGSIRSTGYWKKFNHFLSNPGQAEIRAEDFAIFFDPHIIDEKNVTRIIEKVRSGLGRVA